MSDRWSHQIFVRSHAGWTAITSPGRSPFAANDDSETAVILAPIYWLSAIAPAGCSRHPENQRNGPGNWRLTRLL